MAGPVFVVLTISGKVWPARVESNSYLYILRAVYSEMQGAGSNWDAPWTLLMDRKVVVAEKLNDLAYAYCVAFDKARWVAAAKVDAAHRPDWLPKPEEKK